MNKQKIIITMQKFLQVVHWASIIFLGFWVLIPILGNFIPLEFANKNSEHIYEMIRFYGLPIAAALLILTGMIKRKHTLSIIVTKIILTIFVAVFSFYISVIDLFGNMCSSTTHKVFFENKQNPSIKIVQRSYGCGAIDSSPSVPLVFKVREITSNLIWVTDIDTTQIDKSEWIRIEKQY